MSEGTEMDETGIFVAGWPTAHQVLDIDLGDDSYVYCAHCGYGGIYDYNETGIDRGVKHRGHDFPCKDRYFGEPFCDQCTLLLLPYAHRLHDIEALIAEVNKLERTIRVKRRTKEA